MKFLPYSIQEHRDLLRIRRREMNIRRHAYRFAKAQIKNPDCNMNLGHCLNEAKWCKRELWRAADKVYALLYDVKPLEN